MQCDITQCIGFLATIMRERLSSEFDKRVAPLGLHHKKAGILWQCMDSAHNQASLCGFIQADKNYVRIFIDELESAGLVRREKNPKNRRENLIILTDSGRALSQQSFQIMLEVHDELLSPYLSKGEMQLLHSLLWRVANGFMSELDRSMGAISHAGGDSSSADRKP